MKLRGAGLTPKRGDPWPCSARSVAVDDARDQAFVASDSRVEIYNLKVDGFYQSIVFFMNLAAVAIIAPALVSSLPMSFLLAKQLPWYLTRKP